MGEFTLEELHRIRDAGYAMQEKVQRYSDLSRKIRNKALLPDDADSILIERARAMLAGHEEALAYSRALPVLPSEFDAGGHWPEDSQ